MSSIFVSDMPSRNFDPVKALRWAAKRRGMSPARLSLEVLGASLGRQRLPWDEYFLYGAWQPGLEPSERAAFLGGGRSGDISRRLSPQSLGLNGLLVDKVLTDMVLTRAGLPVAPIRAVAVAVDAAYPYPTLRGPAALAAFLAETPLPFFCKPVHGTRGLGAVSVTGREGEDLILGDGRRVPIAGFVTEVMRHYPRGYVFQDLMAPHPDLARLIGPVIGAVRLVTLRIGGEIILLYSCMKMPGKGQMSDDIASFNNSLAAIDHKTGTILRAQDARRLGGIDMIESPVTGVALPGQALPLWQDVVQLGLAAHRLMVGQGIIGADVLITPDGPRILELNPKPMHGLYQKCFARGFWNRDLAPIVTEALAAVGHKTATRALPFP